ncbi:MAG: hypothetical protein GF417_00490 [Candidatus Latescibacteria bacterium]|nr:hypothetical protein [bacterium]MBD3422905.1 hypothetical protein [Candidatus Latescibacterota bacterium]
MNVPFMALSYQPGMKGIRVSADYRFSLKRYSSRFDELSISLFYKRLGEIDPPASFHALSGGGGGNEEKISFSGVNINLLFSGGLEAGAGYMDWGKWDEGVLDPFDENRDIYTATLRYSFGGRAAAEMQYQRIDMADDSAGERMSSVSDIYSFYSVVEF